MSNYLEQGTSQQPEVSVPRNALGQIAAAPFYIWANGDCANKSDCLKEAKAIRLALFNDGGESVHIVDADGVEVVDAEIEAHEALAKHDFFAGPRRPDVKPEFPGAFMVNDPLDPDGYAIVGDDIAELILEAREHLLEAESELGVSNSTEPVVQTEQPNVSYLVAAIGDVRGVLAQCFARDEAQAKVAVGALAIDSIGGSFKVEVIDRGAAPCLWLEGSAEYIRNALRARTATNYTRGQLGRIGELDAASDAADDHGNDDDDFFAAVAAKDEYIDSQGIDRDRMEVSGRDMQTGAWPRERASVIETAIDKQAVAEIQDTILVFEEEGQVKHCFCSEAVANDRLLKARAGDTGGSMFTSSGVRAESIFSISPNLRERVDAAKMKLRQDILIRDALDRNGVPRDSVLRIGIYKAISELREQLPVDLA